MDTLQTCAFLIISFHISYIKNEFEYKPYTGVKCRWKDKNGTCVNYWTCVTNVVDEAHGIQPPICDYEGNDKEVYTCCTSCYVVANISSEVIFEDTGLWYSRTGKKSEDKCIDYLKNYKYPCYKKFYPGSVRKFYNARMMCYGITTLRWAAASVVDTESEEFPHMALLGYGEELESAQWLCEGTVISEWYILTAGHCRSSMQLGEVQFVALGILKRSDPPSLWQRYRVAQFIPYPKFKPPSMYHDIALILTDREITLGGPVLPACLAQGDEEIKEGDATVWGTLGHSRGTALVVQKVGLTGFSSEECSEMYQPQQHLEQGYNHTTQMCYGDAAVGKDTCEGDSGGPLQLDECPHIVFGVTSTGHPCGFAGGVGLYTRVAFYVPWIESIVWP